MLNLKYNNMKRMLDILFWVFIVISIISWIFNLNIWIGLVSVIVCYAIEGYKILKSDGAIEVPFSQLLWIVFCILRCCDVIDWEIWWIISPLLIDLAIRLLAYSFEGSSFEDWWQKISVLSIRRRTTKKDRERKAVE